MTDASLKDAHADVQARVARVHARCESLLDSLADRRHPLLEGC